MSFPLLRRLLNWWLSRKRSEPEDPIFGIDEGAPKSGDYPRYGILWPELVNSLKALNIVWMLKSIFVPDIEASYTDEESWARIIHYLIFPGDMYEVGDADCDDYARAASTKAALVFKLRCLEAWGNIPGSHAFCMVKTEKGYMLFEPNAAFEHAGELFEIGEYEYTVKSWK